MYHWIKLDCCWFNITAFKCISKFDRTFLDRKWNKNQVSFLFNQNYRTFSETGGGRGYQKIRKVFTKFPKCEIFNKKSRNSSKKINCTGNLITVKNCHFKASGVALFSGNKMEFHLPLEFSTCANRTFGKMEIAATVCSGLTYYPHHFSRLPQN